MLDRIRTRKASMDNVTITEAKSSPQMTLETFRSLVRTLSPDELDKLPLDKLPHHIPDDIVDEAPYESRYVIEQLLFSANAFQLEERSRIKENYGDDVACAMDQANSLIEIATPSMFREKLQALVELQAQYKDTSATQAPLLEMVMEIDDLLHDVKKYSLTSVHALNLLEKSKPEQAEDSSKFESAIDQLGKQLAHLDKNLGEYFVTRLMIVGFEMQRTRLRVETLDNQAALIQEEINRLHDSLKECKTSRRISLSRKYLNERADEIQEQITQLIEEKDRNEILISESDLTGWLDAIVDASLTPFSQNRISQTSRKARLALFHLLQRYCQMQEEAAAQIAKNPFIQSDPEKAIKFMLASEEFILDYFSKKKESVAAWLGNAAKIKIEGLKDLEQNLLKELRNNARLT